jgi:hypothetical protein
MDLADFVQTTLRQILEGVSRAQQAAQGQGKHSARGGEVNPSIMYSADHAPKGKYYATTGRNLVHFVQFDVAVTTESADNASGEGKITVLGVGVAGEGSVASKDTIASRIKFEVPITFPTLREDA